MAAPLSPRELLISYYIVYCVISYLLSAIDINRRLSLLSYVFMLTLYCYSITSVYLYIYIYIFFMLLLILLISFYVFQKL